MPEQHLEGQSIADVFQSHYGLIIAVASRFSPSPDMVYDIVHQTFIDFMTAAMNGRWDPSRKAGPFLAEIAKNRAKNLWRQEKKRSPEHLQKVGETLMAMQRGEKEDWETLNEKISALDGCLQKLPEKSFLLIEKHYFQKISFEQISKDLNHSANTLRKMVCRIRAGLRDCITRELNDR